MNDITGHEGSHERKPMPADRLVGGASSGGSVVREDVKHGSVLSCAQRSQIHRGMSSSGQAQPGSQATVGFPVQPPRLDPPHAHGSGCTDPQTGSTEPPSQGLAHRSFHQWLPFWLGQGYGQEGYAHHDRNTDWWWYDAEYWQRFLTRMQADGFNAYVLWNAHPFPALIDCERFPEARLFNHARIQRNIQAFDRIVRIAKACGIEVILQQYNIQVAPGFAKAHGIPFIPHNGYGGVDSPIIRDYTAYCITRLFETYPDLGGLMTTFELNKDAIGFLRDAILAPLRDHPRAKLHFRLWGQHFVEDVAYLEEMLPGRVRLWHKATEELICLPQADVRLAWWRRQLPGVPLYALVGPCNASGFNFLGRQFFDPRFMGRLVRSLKDAGVDGLGWMAGEDNQWVQHAELEEPGQSQAIERWRSSAWLMRLAAGRSALDPRQDVQAQAAAEAAGRLAMPPAQADRLIEALSIASRADLPYFCRVSPYRGQPLGLNGACGKHSLAEAAMAAGMYRLMGPYALPLHDWDCSQPSLASIARQCGASPLMAKLPDHQAMLSMASEAESLLDDMASTHETAQVLRAYGRINTATARYHANLMKAALHLHRALVDPDGRAVTALLEEAVASVDEALSAARRVGELARTTAAVRVTQRPDLESPHRVGDDWIEPLRKERSQIAAAIDLTRGHLDGYDALHRFRRSWDDYLQVFDLLPSHATRVPPSHPDQAATILDRAIERARLARDRGPVGAAWHRRLTDERAALATPPIPPAGREVVLSLTWRSLTFHSPWTLPRILATDPADQADIPSRRAAAAPVVTLRYEGETVRLTLIRRGDVSNELRVLTATDEQHLKRLRIHLDTGEVRGETAALVPPHGIRFGSGFSPDVRIDEAGDGRIAVTIPARDLCPGPGNSPPVRFNLGHGAEGPYWRCVPDSHADGLLAMDPTWMGLWPFHAGT